MKKSKEFARELRKNQTAAEKILWQELRNRKFRGFKFLRQHPITFTWSGMERFFIADFYCHEAKLVIELDGKIHEKQKDYDQLRDTIISELGLRVVRAPNEKIEKNLSDFLKELSPSLPKRGGRGVSSEPPGNKPG